MKKCVFVRNSSLSLSNTSRPSQLSIISPPNGFEVVPFPGRRCVQLRKNDTRMGTVEIVYPLKIPPKQSARETDGANDHTDKSGTVFMYRIQNLNRIPFPLDMCGTCQTCLGQLIVESLAFTPRQFSKSMESVSLTYLHKFYAGPKLSQSSLVDVLLEDYPLLLDDRLYATPNGSFFHREIESVFSVFGHNPVHTVTGDVAESVRQLLGLYGIDDTLAEFIESHAVKEGKKEREMWLQSVQHCLRKTPSIPRR